MILLMGQTLTQYSGSATVFAALSNATADTLHAAFRTHPNYFTARPQPPATLDDFRTMYSKPLRDFNTAGVVAAHLGQRLSCLSGIHYDVYGNRVQLVKERINECLIAIDGVVKLL